MARVERHVVTPPNQELQGLTAVRSFAPAAGKPTPRGVVPNSDGRGPGGSADLTKQSSPIAPVSHRFNVDQALMPQPPSAIEPGKGAVPVNPFLASGPGLARATTIPDEPTKR